MTIGTGRVNVLRLLTQGLAVACVLVPWITVAQGLTGALIGTVTDADGRRHCLVQSSESARQRSLAGS